MYNLQLPYITHNFRMVAMAIMVAMVIMVAVVNDLVMLVNMVERTGQDIIDI